MSLTDFATFSTAISGIAVTASLIYLALQTHQAAKHTKALIEQGRTARMTDIFLGMSDSDYAAAIIKGHGGIVTPDSIAAFQYFMYFSMVMAGLEDTFGQYEEGLISDDRFKSHSVGIPNLLSYPGFRRRWDAWREARPNIHGKFKVWMDEIESMKPIPSANTAVSLSESNLD